MAERRMFSKSIIESDAFLDLSFSSQVLYFHLSLNADDEGFVNSTRRICSMCGAGEDDLQELISMGFIIKFPSGIYAIKHWKINNKIRKDRTSQTNYPEEKSQIKEKENGVYTLIENNEEKLESFFQDECPAHEEFDYSQEEEEQEEETTEDEVEQASEQTEKKDYAQIVFEILKENDLPCSKGSLITFTMREFKQAMGPILELQLESKDVIQAVKNYAKVIQLKRQGKSWWGTEQNFFHFCEKKTILKFLPENFKLADFMNTKSAKGGAPPALGLEGKIQL